jgi:hypothetical protein
MPYNPNIEINVLKKALAIGAEDALNGTGIATNAAVKSLVASWTMRARQYYRIQAAERRAKQGPSAKPAAKKVRVYDARGELNPRDMGRQR